MSGKKANDSEDDPEDIEDVERLLEFVADQGRERFHPPAIFGGLALAAPFLGFGIGAAIGWVLPHSGSGGFKELAIFFLGVCGALVGCVVGIGLAVYAIRRQERWQALAVLALVLNGGPVLTALFAFLNK